MREVTVRLYTIDELGEEAKARAIEANRDFNTFDDYWYEDLIGVMGDPDKTPGGERAFLAQEPEKEGFEIEEILFSGFSNQGDGASFTGRVDVERYIKHHKLGNKYRLLLRAAQGYLDGDANAWIKRDGYFAGHYVHEYTMSAYVEADAYYEDTYTEEVAELTRERLQEQARGLAEDIEERAKEIARSIYRALEEEYEYQTSDEAIIEGLHANEIEFTEDGGRA